MRGRFGTAKRRVTRDRTGLPADQQRRMRGDISAHRMKIAEAYGVIHRAAIDNEPDAADAARAEIESRLAAIKDIQATMARFDARPR